MKVLINTYPLIFQRKGGIQKRIIEHQKALEKNNVQSSIFTPFERIYDYDILTTFKPFYSNYDVFIEAKKNSLKTVTHVIHELPKNSFLRLIRKLTSHFSIFSSYFERKIITESDVIIALSEKEKKIIQKEFNVNNNRFRIIPNSVEINNFKPVNANIFREKYKIQGDYILSVGRIEPNKNQEVILKAIKNTNYHLIIIGQPVDKSYLKRLKKYSNFTIISDIDYSSEILASAYSGSFCFILASHKEISPNTVIEAALCNTQIICTKNTVSIGQYFGNSIQYFNPKRVYELKKCILNVKNLQSKNNTTSLRGIAVKTFSEKTITQKHLDIYKSL